MGTLEGERKKWGKKEVGSVLCSKEGSNLSTLELGKTWVPPTDINTFFW